MRDKKKWAAYMRKWYAANKLLLRRKARARYKKSKQHRQHLLAKNLRSYYRNHEARRQRVKEHYQKHRRKIIASVNKYRLNNLDEVRKRARELAKLHRAEGNARKKAYKCRRINAMPKWANIREIERLYREARAMTVKTGILHHVDHIYPLRGTTVCGLHVHWNLQILSAIKNMSKGNRL